MRWMSVLHGIYHCLDDAVSNKSGGTVGRLTGAGDEGSGLTACWWDWYSCGQWGWSRRRMVYAFLYRPCWPDGGRWPFAGGCSVLHTGAFYDLRRKLRIHVICWLTGYGRHCCDPVPGPCWAYSDLCVLLRAVVGGSLETDPHFMVGGPGDLMSICLGGTFTLQRRILLFILLILEEDWLTLGFLFSRLGGGASRLYLQTLPILCLPVDVHWRPFVGDLILHWYICFIVPWCPRCSMADGWYAPQASLSLLLLEAILCLHTILPSGRGCCMDSCAVITLMYHLRYISTAYLLTVVCLQSVDRSVAVIHISFGGYGDTFWFTVTPTHTRCYLHGLTWETCRWYLVDWTWLATTFVDEGRLSDVGTWLRYVYIYMDAYIFYSDCRYMFVTILMDSSPVLGWRYLGGYTFPTFGHLLLLLFSGSIGWRCYILFGELTEPGRRLHLQRLEVSLCSVP
jgi:hypothetical protein